MVRRIHRIVLLLALLIGGVGMNYVEAQNIYSGKCGANLTFSYNLSSSPSSLTISGNGAMYNYSSGEQYPWYNHVEGTSKWVHNNYRTLTISSGVTSIGDFAFYESWALRSVSFPSTLKSIGKYAFYEASKGSGNVTPQTITIPNSVTSLGVGAFKHFRNLKTLTIGTGVTAIPDSCFLLCDSLTTVSLPNKLKTIGERAFAFNRKIVSIVIPNTVTSLGRCAFERCEGLKTVTLSSGLKTIGDEAFYYCKALTSVSIPNSVTSLGSGAFAGCVELKTITFGTGLKNIPSYCCSGCSALTSVTIPSGVTIIEFNAFANCSALKTITIPSAVTTIGDKAFYYCSNLTSLTIPSSVKIIHAYAFAGCTSLKTLTIPASVTILSDNSFNNCSGLKDVYLSWTSASDIPKRPANSFTSANLKIHIPCGTEELYRAKGWFDNATPVLPNYYTLTVKSANSAQGKVKIESGTAAASATLSVGCSEKAKIEAIPATGYHFTKWTDNNTSNPRTVTVTAAAAYTANFAINTYTLTVQTATGNTTQGTVRFAGGTAGASASQNFNYNVGVNIIATPATGYHFVQWSDGNTNANRTVTVTAVATYTATFAKNQYTLTVNSNNTNYGTVTGGGTYNHGATANLKATPKTGYHFVQWSDGSTAASRSVTVTSTATYTATFAINTYTLTVNSNNTNYGTVTGGGTYNYNTSVKLNATPTECHRFVKWTDGNTSNPRTVSVTGTKTYTAVFEETQYTVTVQAEDPTMGDVSVTVNE